MENYIKKEVGKYGSVLYYNSKNEFHRTDGPAADLSNGSKCWYLNGKRHRLDGPAVVYNYGVKFWAINNNMYSKSKHNRLYLFSILEPRRMDINPGEGD